MTGKTELKLSKAEVMQAIEYYLNEKVLKIAHAVKDFAQDKDQQYNSTAGNGFTATLEEKLPEEPAK